jgi:hypothetical protein
MRTVWVDFEGAGADRTDIRRMSKQLSKTRFFSHIQGRKLFFKIDRDDVAEAFLISCAKMLSEEGFIIELISKQNTKLK